MDPLTRQPSLLGMSRPAVDATFTGAQRFAVGGAGWAELTPQWLRGDEVLFSAIVAEGAGESSPRRLPGALVATLSARYGARFTEIRAELTTAGEREPGWQGPASGPAALIFLGGRRRVTLRAGDPQETLGLTVGGGDLLVLGGAPIGGWRAVSGRSRAREARLRLLLRPGFVPRELGDLAALGDPLRGEPGAPVTPPEGSERPEAALGQPELKARAGPGTSCGPPCGGAPRPARTGTWRGGGDEPPGSAGLPARWGRVLPPGEPHERDAGPLGRAPGPRLRDHHGEGKMRATLAIDDRLYHRAEALAERLGLTREALYAEALHALLARLDEEGARLGGEGPDDDREAEVGEDWWGPRG